MVKNSLANARDIRETGSVPGLKRSPGGGHGNPLQYSCLENLHGQKSMVGYSPKGCKESDMTEQLNGNITLIDKDWMPRLLIDDIIALY